MSRLYPIICLLTIFVLSVPLNCMYGDGVLVGAFARFLLAQRYKQTGNAGKATRLFEEIKKDYPAAIDHHG